MVECVEQHRRVFTPPPPDRTFSISKSSSRAEMSEPRLQKLVGQSPDFEEATASVPSINWLAAVGHAHSEDGTSHSLPLKEPRTSISDASTGHRRISFNQSFR
jgi:hypothetical protein